MAKFIDLTGKRFGRLLVSYRVENKERKACWHCVCDCGNEKDIVARSLTSGATVSCGCYNREISRLNGKFKNMNNCMTTNEYEFTVDTCIGYTSKGENFLVDIDKYDLIKDYSWYISDKGYVVTNMTKNNGKQKKISLHRFITNCPDNLVVDHIHGKESRFDNRSSNLRVCTNQENQFNKSHKYQRDIKVKGVSKHTYRGKTRYQAHIQINKKSKNLGLYQTIKEAADAYDKAAKELFGEFAWLNNYIATPEELKIIEKNKTVKEMPKTNYCEECGKIISSKNTYCKECYHIHNRKVDRPSRDELKKLVRLNSFKKIGKMFSVSDNTIRKWCNNYNIPCKSNEIKNINEDEWLLI